MKKKKKLNENGHTDKENREREELFAKRERERKEYLASLPKNGGEYLIAKAGVCIDDREEKALLKFLKKTTLRPKDIEEFRDVMGYCYRVGFIMYADGPSVHSDRKISKSVLNLANHFVSFIKSKGMSDVLFEKAEERELQTTHYKMDATGNLVESKKAA